MDMLNALADRNVIVALAIAGAIIATVGSLLGHKRSGLAARRARAIVWAGYAVSGVSVALFIVAGFLSSR
jgi:hypothetical protein